MDSNSNLTYYQSLLNTTISNADNANISNIITNSIQDTSLTAKCPLFSDANQYIISQGPMTNGQLIIGNTGNLPTIGTLSVSSNLVETTGAGTLSLDTIQNIQTTSSVTFNDLTLSSLTASYPVLTNATKKLISALIDLTTNITGILPIANGGTNISTYSQGDILYASAANVLSKLSLGSNTYLLSSDGNAPFWAGPLTITVGNANGIKITNVTADGTYYLTFVSSNTGYNSVDVNSTHLSLTVSSGSSTLFADNLSLTNPLPLTQGGTGFSTYAQGNIIYASATNTLSKLTIGSNTYLLQSNGTIPGWVSPTTITSGNTNNVNVTDTSTVAVYFPTFVDNVSGYNPIKVDSSGLFYTISGGSGELRSTKLFVSSSSGFQLATSSTGRFTIQCTNSTSSNTTLTINTNNASRTLTINGSPTLDDWFDQSVKTTGTPTFSLLTVTPTSTAGNQISMSAGIAGELGLLVNNTTSGTTAYGKIKVGSSGGGEIRMECISGSFSGTRYGLSAGNAGIINSFASLFFCTGTDGTSSGDTTKALEITTTQAAKFTSTVIYKGFTDASNASAGYVGEALRSFVAQGSAISLTSNTWADVTSISITAGDWDVTGIVGFTQDVSLNPTLTQMAITSTSGNSSSGVSLGDNSVQSVTNHPNSVGDEYLNVPAYRININSTTTYYLKALCTFGSGGCKAYGRISARRVR